MRNPLFITAIGVYTRFFYYKIIRNPKTLSFLWNDGDFANWIVGSIVFILISVSIAYLVFS